MPAVTPELKARFEDAAIPLMDHVYTAALYLARDQFEAEDLLQETYLRAFRAFHRFVAGTKLKAWLLTILYNVWRNRYRDRMHERRRRDSGVVADAYRQFTAAASDGPAADPAEHMLHGLGDDSEVGLALRRLPHEFRAAVLLVDVQELSYAEAASTLGCPVGTVRSRLARGRRLLQCVLGDLKHGRHSGRS